MWPWENPCLQFYDWALTPMGTPLPPPTLLAWDPPGVNLALVYPAHVCLAAGRPHFGVQVRGSTGDF